MSKQNYQLQRRGFHLGYIACADGTEELSANEKTLAWEQGTPIVLRNRCQQQLHQNSQYIQQAETLYLAVLEGTDIDGLLAKPPYIKRLNQFDSLGSSINEGDAQEIETIVFDAIDANQILAEDLWMKISWLSFYEKDASLRFRFSFGADLVEDVAADATRQHYAAQLTDAIFPESKLITYNQELVQEIQTILNATTIHFVERIVYFNAPDGGAYLHHDRERGHAGVVYAQVTGKTAWLALPKGELIKEISEYTTEKKTSQTWPASIDSNMQNTLIDYCCDLQILSDQLESFSDECLISLINETEEFIQRLIHKGHAHILCAGDVILLPQESETQCCWHSVFNLGEQTGQALSFAIRTNMDTELAEARG